MGSRIGKRVKGENDFTGLINYKCLPAGNEKLPFHPKHFQYFVTRIAQQNKRQPVMLYEFPVAFYRSRIDTNHYCAGFCEFRKIISERAGLFRTTTAFIPGIKKNYEDIFTGIIINIKYAVILIPEGKYGNRVTHLKVLFLPFTSLEKAENYSCHEKIFFHLLPAGFNRYSEHSKIAIKAIAKSRKITYKITDKKMAARVNRLNV
jgi:hypothetical protein